jgi:hypothetical protein
MGWNSKKFHNNTPRKKSWNQNKITQNIFKIVFFNLLHFSLHLVERNNRVFIEVFSAGEN